jgi:hypothetical protein
MNKYTNLRKMFAQSEQQDHKFNKKLHESDIIQEILERIAELEDRLDKLEQDDNKEVNKFGI